MEKQQDETFIRRFQFSNYGEDEVVPIHTIKAYGRMEVELHSF
jgi:hypothetical protein